ncbi:MAG: ABC transporter ATP-binding protein [Planctomycetota bacterium]
MNASPPTLAELMPRSELTSPAVTSAIRDPQSAITLLHATDLYKTYRNGAVGTPVLQGVDLHVRAGEMLAVVGQSGSGKSTLLHLLATLDKPDAGEVRFEGHRIDNLPRRGRDVLRNRHLGMIFQAYHLMPELDALENVLLPAMIRHGVLGYWAKRGRLRERARELLNTVGLGHRLTHKPRQLSGGEQQRVAIARSLMPGPKLLLADEPTGNLDGKTGGEVLELLERLNADDRLTLVLVTHDSEIAARCHRSVTLVDGRVENTRVAA